MTERTNDGRGDDERADLESDVTLAAGDFSAWLHQVQGAIRGEHGSSVPCDGCTACCRSSQFVAIEPDETETLAHIPAELLFPAPRRPRGHVLLAYDEHGHCPMLVDDRCSIYEHRPRACRTYDCRVLPAAGLDIGTEPGKERIARRTRRWRFSYPSATDRAERDAVHAATAFLQTHAAELPANVRPANTTQLAVLAVELHDMFLPRDTDSGQDSAGAPDPDAVRVELTRRTRART